jgi:hypothetical protein
MTPEYDSNRRVLEKGIGKLSTIEPLLLTHPTINTHVITSVSTPIFRRSGLK